MDKKKRVVICIDSVPYRTINSLWKRGLFGYMKQPTKLISSFPSLTDTILQDIFGLEKSKGYESVYFDIKKNAVKGGCYEHLCKNMGKIEKGLFDYRAQVYFDVLGYFFPVFTANWDLHKLKKKLLSSKKPFFKAFITTTDQLCHSRGEEHLKDFLMRMSQELRDISENNEIVLFSDHGNNFVKSKRIALEAYLKKIGFVVKNSLVQDNDVVVPKFGLLNFAALYTNGNKRLLAEKFTQLKGVDLIIFQEMEWVYIYKGTEKARSTYNDKGFRYETLSGDPLKLLDIIDKIKKSDGYVAKDELYCATQDHMYNNVLEKIHNSVNCAKNKASVMLSLEDGYYFGKRWFELVVRIKGTHGGLRSETTDGFLMTNFESTEDFLRVKDVARYML